MSAEDFISTVHEIFQEVAEKMGISATAYYQAQVSFNSNQVRPRYSAYFAYGDRMNDSVLFGGFSPEEVLSAIRQFEDGKDHTSISILYLEKQIASNEVTIKAHKDKIKRLREENQSEPRD